MNLYMRFKRCLKMFLLRFFDVRCRDCARFWYNKSTGHGVCKNHKDYQSWHCMKKACSDFKIDRV